MRGQTQTNRHLGLNAGRQRREAAGNREAISQARRGEVFRQDVEHTGMEPVDAIRAHRAAMWTLVLKLAEEGKTRRQIADATGYAVATIRAYLSTNAIPCGDYKPQKYRRPGPDGKEPQ